MLPACANATVGFPTKPITLVVAFGPGSGNDLIARELAQQRAKTLGRLLVAKDRARQPPRHQIATGDERGPEPQPALRRGPWPAPDRPGEPHPLLLAASATGPRSLADLIAQAKAKPDTLSDGSAGLGSIGHTVAEAFAKAADVQLLHAPYGGNGQALAELAGGHAPLVVDGLPTTAPLAQQGRVQLLAISCAQRSPAAPEFAPHSRC